MRYGNKDHFFLSLFSKQMDSSKLRNKMKIVGMIPFDMEATNGMELESKKYIIHTGKQIVIP